MPLGFDLGGFCGFPSVPGFVEERHYSFSQLHNMAVIVLRKGRLMGAVERVLHNV
jgi:hypothetical protein